MIKVKVENKNSEFSFNFPNCASDITHEYLAGVTNNLIVTEHQSLVAIIGTVKISDIGLINPNSKKNTLPVNSTVPVFVKSALRCEDIVARAHIGDILRLDTEAFSYAGYEIDIPNNIYSPNNYIKMLKLHNDIPNLASQTAGMEPVYCVTFKIIPNSLVKGYFDNTVAQGDYSIGKLNRSFMDVKLKETNWAS